MDLRPPTLAVSPLWNAPEAPPLRRRRGTDRLLRTGHLLTASSLTTSALGAGYWVFVARWYSPTDVGRGYAAVSAMMFLAGFGQLNLANTLVRFVPTAGRGTLRLIRRVYLVAIGFTALLAAGFVLFVPHISPALDFLHTGRAGLGFTVGAAGYALFVIQDGALTGLLRAGWVLLENTVFSAAKMGFVVLFAVLALPEGILASWYAALGVAIVLTNWYLFARAIPTRTRTATAGPDPASQPTGAYLAADFTGAMFWLTATTLMPVIVLDRLGPDQSAYFSLPWMVAYTLYLLSTNMGASIVVEAANDAAGLAANCRRVLRHAGPLLAAAVGAGVLGAPLILRLFGPGYAAHATGLIRLLLLSALPNLVVASAVASGRARRRIGAVVSILAADCSCAIALSFLLLPRLGIAGAGYGWLLAQSSTALVLLVRRSWWLGSSEDARSGNVRHGAGPDTADRVRQGTEVCFAALRWAGRAGTWPADRVAAFRAARIEAAPGAWRAFPAALHAARTPSDLLVVRVRRAEAITVAVKWARTVPAQRTLSRQGGVLRVLHSDERLGDWRTLLPRIVASESGALPRWTAECWLPGISGTALLRDEPAAEQRLTAAAMAAIEDLHRLTGRGVVVGGDHLDRWVDAPLHALEHDLARHRHQPSPSAAAALRELIRNGLDGRELTVGWVHRDFHPGNVLYDGDTLGVTGIVDWAGAVPDGPTAIDATLFALAVEHQLRGATFGELVVEALGAPRHDETDLSFLLLAWLWHITDNLDKSMYYHNSRLWIRRNILDVLEAVAR